MRNQSKKVPTRSLRKIILILPVIFFLLVLLPNHTGILKAVGIMETDFKPSTSEAVFESQNRPFTLQISDKNNPQLATMKYILNGKQFTLTALNSVASVSASPIPQIPSDVTADIQVLQKSLNEIETESLRMSGSTSQSYFGPHETIRQNQILGGSISHYLLGVETLQEWKIVDKIESIQILFQSSDFDLHIRNNGDWEIIDSLGNGALISSVLSTNTGQNISLTSDNQSSLSTNDISKAVTITLPSSVINDYQTSFPLTFKRTISPLAPTQITTNQYPGAISASSNPTTITAFRDGVIIGDPINQQVLLFRQNNLTPLLSNVSPTAITCNDNNCVFSTSSTELFQFDPNNISATSQPFDNNSVLEKIDLKHPISSLAYQGDHLMFTTNSNPNGEVIKRLQTGELSSLLSNLTYPEQLSVSPDSSLLVLKNADVVTYKQSASSQWNQLSIPLHIKLVAAGSDNTIYLVALYPRTNQDIVLRANISQNNIEVLASVTGTFSAIAVTPNTLYLSIPGQTSGLLWPISLPESRWQTTTEFTQNQ